MGTKLVRFTVDIEVDKDVYYDALQWEEPMTPIEFAAWFVGNLAEPNYQRTIKFEGLVGHDGALVPS